MKMPKKKKKAVVPRQKKKKAVVPRLRFPEFRDAGEWEVRRLGEIARKRTERNQNEHVTRVLTNSAEKGVIDQQEYFKKDIAVQGNLSNYFVVHEGDFVYNPRISAAAPVGPISRNNVGKGVMSPLYTVFFFDDPETDFFFYYCGSHAWHSYMRSVGSMGARHDRMAISNEDFFSMPLPMPPKPEQQKIADCLASLDDLIRALKAQLVALKDHKKGLMQQLFPREGETSPRLRFPEFRDAGEWEVKRLGEVVNITGGGTPSRSVKEFWNGDIPWVSSSDVSDESIHELKVTRRITAEAVSKSATKIVPENSILLVSRVGVGKLAVSRIPVCTSQDFTNLIPNEDDYLFLGYYLSAWTNVLKDFSQGMAIQGFTKEGIESLAIPLPKVALHQIRWVTVAG